MRRRDLITLLGGAVWPLAVRAQSGKLPTIGFLGGATPSSWSRWTAAFARRLPELGWIDGRTVAIEYRWAAGQNDKLPALAADLIRRQVNVIATPGSTPAALAAKAATASIPAAALRR